MCLQVFQFSVNTWKREPTCRADVELWSQMFDVNGVACKTHFCVKNVEHLTDVDMLFFFFFYFCLQSVICIFYSKGGKSSHKTVSQWEHLRENPSQQSLFLSVDLGRRRVFWTISSSSCSWDLPAGKKKTKKKLVDFGMREPDVSKMLTDSFSCSQKYLPSNKMGLWQLAVSVKYLLSLSICYHTTFSEIRSQVQERHLSLYPDSV